jgi:hypothetical protein
MAGCVIWSCVILSASPPRRLPCHHPLDEVEYRDAVADGREQTCAVWGEEQVAAAVHGPQQVGELGVGAVSHMIARHGVRAAHLEVRLHFGALDSRRGCCIVAGRRP